MLLPWDAMMQAAGRSGVSPAAFWRLSLREWRWLTGGQAGTGGAPMRGADLAALMARWPDAGACAESSEEEAG